jgi:FRG domain
MKFADPSYFPEARFCTEAAEISPWMSSQTWIMPFIVGLRKLRHMGVPSPLLDWSHSPFIAAYFAFSEANPLESEPVAVFLFQEQMGSFGRYVCNQTSLNAFYSNGQSHDREMKQQSAYTLCVKDGNTHGNSVGICDHEQYFSNVWSTNSRYERLVKYTIPASERRAAMKDIERMNITEASLFGGEDAMARTLFRRTVD